MDTKTLVVGQKVWMQSGPYAKEVTVIETTEQYVVVELPRAENTVRAFIRFDANGSTGTGWDGLGYFECTTENIDSMLQSDPRTPGTDYGPWELVDTRREKVPDAPTRTWNRFLGEWR